MIWYLIVALQSVLWLVFLTYMMDFRISWYKIVSVYCINAILIYIYVARVWSLILWDYSAYLFLLGMSTWLVWTAMSVFGIIGIGIWIASSTIMRIICEECIKYFPLRLWWYQLSSDIILYALISWSWFAMIENIVYAYHDHEVFTRWISTTLVHIVSSWLIWYGMYCSWYKRYVFISLWFIVHIAYNIFIIKASDRLLILRFVVLYFIMTFLFQSIQKFYLTPIEW